MTAAEIADKIVFVTEDAGDLLHIAAHLDYKRTCAVVKNELKRGLSVDQVKADMKEGFLRELYQDQRDQLLEELEKLSHLPPGLGNYAKWRAGVMSLLRAGKWQEPDELAVQKRLAAAHHETATVFMNQVKRLQAALYQISSFPVQAEPVGAAMAMQDIASEALKPKRPDATR